MRRRGGQKGGDDRDGDEEPQTASRRRATPPPPAVLPSLTAAGLCCVVQVSLLGLPRVSLGSAGLPSLFTSADAIDIVSWIPISYLHLRLGLALAATSPDPVPVSRIVAGMVLVGCLAAGHGMHAVANSVDVARNHVLDTDGLGYLVYFLHETVAHNLQAAAQWGLFLLQAFTPIASTGRSPPPPPALGFTLGWAVPLLHAAAIIPFTIGTRTMPLTLCVCMFLVATGMLRHTSPVRTYVTRVAVVVALGLFAWVVAHNGTAPTFDDLRGEYTFDDAAGMPPNLSPDMMTKG